MSLLTRVWIWLILETFQKKVKSLLGLQRHGRCRCLLHFNLHHVQPLFFQCCLFNGTPSKPIPKLQIFNFRIIFKKTKQQKKQLSKNTSSGKSQRQLHNFFSPSNSTPITPSSKTTARTTKPECPIVRKVLPDIFRLRTLVQGASVRRVF